MAQLISMGDIAALAGVRRPVVTTWRRRHPDFPAPISSSGTRPLFDPREVADWTASRLSPTCTCSAWPNWKCRCRPGNWWPR